MEGLKKSIQQKEEEENKKDEGETQHKKKRIKPIEEYQGHDPYSDAACFFQPKYDEKRF